MNDETSPKPSSKSRRWRIAVAVLAIPLLALGWLVGSEGGFRLLCAGLTRLTDSRLLIEAPVGRLLGDWHAQSVRWLDASQEVELQQLQVNWSPRGLLHGQVEITRIEAASLRVDAPPSSEATTLPESLELPLPVRIAHLALGKLLFGEHGEDPTVLAEGVEAELKSDGQTYSIDRLQAQFGQLEIAGEATLAASAPYGLNAHASLKGRALDQSFTLELRGSGPLAQIQVEGRIVAVAKVSGDLRAVLTPFAAQPVASLGAHFTGLDPAVFIAGAPQASLDVDVVLESQPAGPGESAAKGRLSVSNQSAGTLDRQLIPLESLQSGVDWQQGRLTFPGLTLALTGGGKLKGQGSLAGRMIDLDLAASGIDAHALHGDLVPTQLAGTLHALLGSDRQTVELDLRDAKYAVTTQASLAADAVEVGRLQLATGDARLSAKGRLALSGDKRFAAQGSLHHFDPARFFKAKPPVRSLINADFDARGALGPALELALHFDLHDSRLGAQKLAGKGDIDLRGTLLRKINVDLDAAGNRLNATGAFGKAGDSMRLQLQAPKLEAIGWAGLAGDATADFLVGGSVANLEISGEVRAGQLHIANWIDVRDLTLDGQLAAGAQGKLRGDFRCAACSMPEHGVPVVALELGVDGLRSQHRLNGWVGLPDQRELRFALEGGLKEQVARQSGGVSSLSWNGMLSELIVGSRQAASAKPLLNLDAPAPLNLRSAAFAFGPATIDGLLGKMQVDRLGHEQGRWLSAGRWQQFRPQALLSEFPALHAGLTAISKANPQPLLLDGEWDFALDSKPAALPVGRAAVWRESGDVVLGSVALGLSEARIQASLGEGRVIARAQMRGARLGEISADMTASSARQADGRFSSLIDPQAPWQGRLQAVVPDVAWLGPFIGEAWQVAGKLNGEMRLGGSPAQPQFDGEWRGQDLALRALDLGMRLERGQALVEIAPDRLLLRQLSFESDFQSLPPVLKLDRNVNTESLIGTPGRVEVSGELAFASGEGGADAHLNIYLDRLGVVQRSDQWIALSGEGELRVGEQALDVGGKLRVDAGLWSLAESGRPSLSDDVVIRKAQGAGGKSTVTRQLRLDLEAALGRSVHFRGAGVESRLAGQIRVRSDAAGLPRASGSIRTVGGRFDAYGQKLGIQRGIINFQGPIDNPGLNILAVRESLPVEAGVEVTGTAQRPRIRIVSTPEVPDTEKLSWLVLGHSPEQQASGDGGVLLAAAQTILGGQDGGVLRQLQRGLGIDEFGVSTGEIGGYGKQPTSRVASSSGFGGSQTVNGQIVTVGKRLSSNALLSYEQSLSTADSIVKLTVNLSRQFSVVGRAGSESALDFFWHYRFGR